MNSSHTLRSNSHPQKLLPLTFKTLFTSSKSNKTQMADRFFPNNLPEFIQEEEPPSPETTTTTLLYLPYNSFSNQLKQAALNLKETIVTETWGRSGGHLSDYTLYTGALGTAFLVFKSYQITHNKQDLDLCKDIVKACDSASFGSSRVTFLCGLAGVYALGAVVAKEANDDKLLDYYLTRFRKIKITKDLPDELLYGRAGYLWACMFLNKNLCQKLGQDAISSTHMTIITDEIMRSGRKLPTKDCPLMYEWHGKKYWGAAHGLVGIMHVLLDMDLAEHELDDVKSTLFYMIKNRFPSGNYPSSEGSESDRLVHWCHGAPDVALTLAKAAKVLYDEELYKAAVEAGEVVWERGLLKRVGICHGISGNTYVFLSLYRLTGDVKYLYRAKAFAAFLHEQSATLISQGLMHGGDHPFSLFEGVGGMAYLFMDMIEPLEARFPAYEL